MAAKLAAAHTTIAECFSGRNRIVSGSRNSRTPVALFISEWTDTNLFCTAKPEMIFTAFMKAMIPIQAYSHAGIHRMGSYLTRHTVTNTKSAIVSSLAPSSLAVSVFLAANPSSTSDKPAAM